jgi:hypothetical protein
MINLVEQYGDADFWKTPKKVLEPTCGKGGFLLDIVNKFMIGLEDEEKDEELRYRMIVEDCLYFADINARNIYICKLLLDPCGKYKLNAYCGDSLKQEFPCKFDLVIGNPPYTSDKSSVKGQGGQNIWIKFCENSFKDWLKHKGFLVFIHPPIWRKPYINETPNSIFYRKMMKKNILFIKTYKKSDVKNIMAVSTRVDYYLIQNTKYHGITDFVDYYSNKYTININEFKFIPNAYLTIFEKIFSKFVIGIKAYKTSKTEKSEIEYPFIYNLTNTKTVIKNIKKKHIIQDKSKVLFSDTREPKFIYDTGVYGLTSHICYIETENDSILKYLNSNLFKFMIKHSKYSTFQTDWEFFHNIPDIKIYEEAEFEEADIYKFFNLTENEKNIIEKNLLKKKVKVIQIRRKPI